MWPWGHLGVGYLLYSLYARGQHRQPPQPEPALAAVLGSQFPDIVDKPLAWLGVLPGGRTLAHSLVFAGVAIVTVYATAVVYNRTKSATAFALAYLSHLVTDLPPRVLLGFPRGSEYLFWPVLPQYTFEYRERVVEVPPVVESAVIPLTDPLVYSLVQVVAFVLALGLWYVDGCPGVQYLRLPNLPSGR